MVRLASAVAASALLAALAVGVAGARPGAVPGACKLLTQKLVDSYFGETMRNTADRPNFCDWQSKDAKSYKGASLTLVTWRLPANAVAVINGVCNHLNGVKKSLQFPIPGRGADRACGFEAPTGLCVDGPKGSKLMDYCQQDVTIKFLHGATTGSLELASLEKYTSNNLANGAAFARSLLASWK